MNKKDHIAKANALLEKASTVTSSPHPWKFEWDGDSPPIIYDADGKCVTVLSTGTLSGAYDTDTIISNAASILQCSNPGGMIIKSFGEFVDHFLGKHYSSNWLGERDVERVSAVFEVPDRYPCRVHKIRGSDDHDYCALPNSGSHTFSY